MLTTESPSIYTDLDKMSTDDLLLNMNREDAKIHEAIYKVIPLITEFIDKTVARMKQGGRLFYIGAGTSGRLGILDASEIPPTYGVYNKVIGLIAGGDKAIRNAVENAEDDEQQAWKDLQEYDINENDVLLGIAASGRTPYVIGGVKKAKEMGLLTGCITCNVSAKVIGEVDIPLVAEVGPEFVTGSTRMKSGTAQKLILNMISTSCMIKLGHVKGNKMVDMQLSNKKLVQRGTNMIIDEIGVAADLAEELLLQHGSVRKAVEAYQSKVI